MQPNVGEGFSWMAWTWQTAVFWLVILTLLIIMAIWEHRDPGGGPRRGALRLVTTRGDRLFMSLLSAAYIHLIWLAFVGTPLWPATGIAVGVALLIFRFV
jgi:predicted small integral membrane protein